MTDTPILMYAILSEEALTASGGNRGKMAAQCGHAFVRCAQIADLDGHIERLRDYAHCEAKIVLKAPEAMFEQLLQQHRDVPTTLVQDAGHTVLAPGTVTCIGIGPIYRHEVSEDLGALKVWI